MLFDDFVKSIETEKPMQCYQITGEDVFWTRKSYEKVLSLADSVDVVKATAPEKIEDAMFSLVMFPMLSEYKIVVLDGYQKFSAEDKKKVTEYLDNPMDGAILVLYNTENINHKKIAKYSFAHVGEGALVPIVVELAESYRGKIQTDAARLLIGYAETDMSIINNELSKLIAYANGEVITVQMVKECVTPNVTYQVYHFADAVAVGDYEKAYGTLYSLTHSTGEYSRYLSNIITYYRTVFYAKISTLNDIELASLLITRDFVVKKARRIAQKYTAIELLELLKMFYRLEYEFKSGKISLENALELAIAEAIERRKQ